MKLPRIFYIAFGGVSGLLLTIAAVIFYYNQKATNQYTHIEGVVARNQSVNGMARPIITYSWEGKELTYISTNYTNPPAFERGEKVELFVNPDDSKDVYINSFTERWLAMTIVGGIGIFFLGFLALFHYLWQR
jgi:vacuolar-type H+-ATPase subunit I/STV1